ncbi:MAG: Crp/Fnr family transcriptional regulator, partial [Rhodopila sp.]
MIQPTAVRNRLLSGLPLEVLNQLLPKLHQVPLILRKTLARPGEPIEAVYFVESGWVSLVAHMDEGTQAEVGLIGREGMIGQALVNGVDTAFAEAFVQASGEALQIDASAFQSELDRHPPFLRRLLRYAEAMQAQLMQAAACNGRHQI